MRRADVSWLTMRTGLVVVQSLVSRWPSALLHVRDLAPFAAVIHRPPEPDRFSHDLHHRIEATWHDPGAPQLRLVETQERPPIRSLDVACVGLDLSVAGHVFMWHACDQTETVAGRGPAFARVVCDRTIGDTRTLVVVNVFGGSQHVDLGIPADLFTNPVRREQSP